MEAKHMRVMHGRPTAPDVEKLLAVFAGLCRDGHTVKHEEIERAIGERRDSARYRTVVNAWRKQILSQGLVLDGTKAVGVGFVVLRAAEMVEQYSPSQFRQATRKVAKAVKVAGLAPDEELDASQRTRREHAMLHYGSALSSMTGARKAIGALTRPPAALPRR